MRRIFVTLTAFVLVLFSAGIVVAAEDANTSSVVVAKTAGDAVLIWDASPEVASLLEKKLADDKISEQLEVGAAKVLLARAKELPNARTITVKVVYERTGAVSPIYKTATLTGLERLLSVSAPRADALEHGSAWSKTLQQGTLPSGITATVTGKYPH
jgi:hypothetical protein